MKEQKTIASCVPSKVSTFLTRKAVSIDVVQPAGLLRALGHPLVVMGISIDGQSYCRVRDSFVPCAQHAEICTIASALDPCTYRKAQSKHTQFASPVVGMYSHAPSPCASHAPVNYAL